MSCRRKDTHPGVKVNGNWQPGAEALEHLAGLLKAPGVYAPERLHLYFCKQHRGWHVGHMKKEAVKALERMHQETTT